MVVDVFQQTEHIHEYTIATFQNELGEASDIWDSGVAVNHTCILGNFDLVVFNLILESFGALSAM